MSGLAIPAMNPTTGPPIKAASKTGRCMGRNAAPAAAPVPDKNPIKWNHCGNATERAIADTVISVFIFIVGLFRTFVKTCHSFLIVAYSIARISLKSQELFCIETGYLKKY